jgi:uncharacterized damage-inducible protein DinB
VFERARAHLHARNAMTWADILFNHQTHHRGQVHDQLSQTAVPPPPLDLVFYLRETGAPR